jgi:signal transduction histidine kinase
MDSATPTLADIAHGDHCCLLFSSEQDQLEVTVPFLALGIERGERSLYVGDPGSVERVREGCKSFGLDVAGEVTRGRLVLDSRRDFLEKDQFVTDRMLGFLQQAYDETLGQGYAALRAAGDVSWQVGPRSDFSDIVYYEALLDLFFLGKRMVGMCEYPRDRVPEEVLAGILDTHRTALFDRTVCHNSHYLPPELLIEKDTRAREAKRLEWVTSQLLRVRKAESDRKLLEAQLHQSQKMEAIGRLAGGIAHDFNNIMMVILGNCELATEQRGLDDPLVRGALREVKDAAERATGLTRQLLAFSRKQVLEPQILNLNEVVVNVDRFLRRLIGEDIEVSTQLAAGLDKVTVDPNQVEQIILNLAVNARDAMPTGGKLTIETANVTLDLEYAREHEGVVPGPFVMLAMSDSGVGMTPEVRARIFEPFFTTKPVDKGTGLGLATVYGIVKQSGGDVWVYSEPGKGTTFKVYFPSSGQAVGVTGEAAVPPRPGRGETILVVEDDPSLRRLVRHVLEAGGYEVIMAEDGEEALRLSAEHAEPIHLMLTDVVLPGISGPDLADRLTALRPGLKIVFTSGYTDDAVIRHGKLEQGTAFVQKPAASSTLLRRIGELLNS